MRRILWMAAVAVLVLAVAAPAMALDFKFGGQYRVRFYSGDNLGGNSPTGIFDHANPNRNVRGAQLRVRPSFSVSDDNGNIQAFWQAEIGDIEFGNGGGAHGVVNGVNQTPGSARTGNGAGGSLGADGVNVETKYAYLDFAMPWNVPLRVRSGIQYWYLPKGIIVDDDVIGVRAYGKSGIVSYEGAWFRTSGGPNTNTGVCPPAAANTGVQCNTSTSNTQDNNFDFWQFRTDVAIASWLNPGLYFLYGANKATGAAASFTPADAYFVGLTATGKVGIVSYDFDFVYGSAEGGPNGNILDPANGQFVKNNGLMFDAGVHFPIGPVTINVMGSYASGDQQNGGTSEAFPYISPSWNGASGGYELIGSGGTFDAIDAVQDAPTNLWMIGASVEYRPVKALWLRLAYGFAGFASKHGNCAVAAPVGETGGRPCIGPSYAKLAAANSGGGAPWLGQEISLRADYDLWTGFKIQGALGWLIPYSGNPASEYVLQFLYNF